MQQQERINAHYILSMILSLPTQTVSDAASAPSDMPAHCLQIQEILLHIFELVFATKKNFSDLAALARTCRTFNEPALAVLWRSLSSLSPLILCFPSDVLIYTREGSATTLKFARSPTVQDWERPSRYARLIEEIETRVPLTLLEGYKLHPSVLQTLADSCPETPVLSRLRHLDLRKPTRDMEGLSYIQAFFKLSSPTLLQSLKFSFLGRLSADDARACLTQGMELCKNIESLNLRLDNDSVLFSEYFLAFASLQKLKSLTVSGAAWDPEETEIPSEDLFTSSLTKSFPTLRKLRLNFFSVPRVLEVLKAVRSKHLHDIHFVIPYSQADPEELCAVLAQHQAMHAIVIRRLTASSRSLDHLLTIKHLRHLTLYITALDDDRIDSMTKSWPMLEELCLYSDTPLPENVTLKSLFSFRKYCPHLQCLELRLNASEIPQLALTDDCETAYRPSLLLRIDVCSPIQSSKGVAEFLMALFPHVQVVLNSPSRFLYRFEEMRIWKGVAEIIDERLKQVPCPVPSTMVSPTALRT